ncbi:hypothetical protein G6L74_06275 [Agrobacterium tumefaciens]|uniref:hypothetical protein n=1 Tax=Agrobacterium tumefaciens TaxID=358 RepID=UPI0015717FFB|nr:hypothetical protein [Agrobacterium tumefaciens]
MTDFATLVLAADSRSLKAGEKDLDSIAATADRAERRVGKATDSMAKGFNGVAKQSTFAGQQMRMTSMQLSQVAQQASVTGDWLQAIAIQLPDLALGLGPIGILAGAAAGALLPLAANFLTASENSDTLENSMSRLAKATDSYAEAVANSLLSASDLVEKFGAQAEGASRVYDALRKIAELDFAKAMGDVKSALEGTIQPLDQSIEKFDLLAKLPRMQTDGFDAYAAEVQNLANEFGLTAEQGRKVTQAMDDLSNAQGPVEIAQAAMRLGDSLTDAANSGAKLSPELQSVQRDAYKASVDAAEFARMTGQAVGHANELATAVGGVADQYARAANIAAALNAQATKDILSQLGPLNTLNAFERTPFKDEMQLQNERAANTKSLYQIEAEREAKKGSRSANSEAKKYERERQSVADLIKELEEELSLVGQSETAKRSAAAIRQAGATATDQEREAIASLITQIDAEQEARDRQIDTMDQYKDSVGSVLDDVRSAMDDGKITWDEWADIALNALDKVISRIQDDLLDAMFSVNKASSGGGGGGFLSSLFSGLFGGGTGGFAKLPSVGPVPIARPSFDGGGYTGSGSRSGGLDGKGGFWAMMHPDETVIDHTKGQSASSQTGGTSEVLVSLSPELVGQILDQAQGQTVKIVAQNNKNKQVLYQNGEAQVG